MRALWINAYVVLRFWLTYSVNYNITMLKHIIIGQVACRPFPAGTRRNNNVIITSKRRHGVVLTWWWRGHCVVCPLGCCQINECNSFENNRELSWMKFTGIRSSSELQWLTLTHWGRDKMDAISQTTFSNAFSWMKMYWFRLRFHWNSFSRVQLTIFQHWFR